MSRKDLSNTVVPILKSVCEVVGVARILLAILSWIQVSVLPLIGRVICVPPDSDFLVAGAVYNDARPGAVFGETCFS